MEAFFWLQYSAEQVMAIDLVLGAQVISIMQILALAEDFPLCLTQCKCYCFSPLVQVKKKKNLSVIPLQSFFCWVTNLHFGVHVCVKKQTEEHV